MKLVSRPAPALGGPLLGPPLATGRTAEIYRWQGGQVLKLLRRGYGWAAAEHEARVARVIRATGLPVPEAGDVFAVGDRVGLLYRRVEGQSLREFLQRKPWAHVYGARLLAELHAAVHVCEVPELPAAHEVLAARLCQEPALAPAMRAALLRRLASLPEGNRLIHADFHPDNVLLTPAGPVLIDWPDACRGNPLADVAWTRLLLRVGAPPPGVRIPAVMDLGRRWIERLYLRRYLSLVPASRAQLAAWEPVIAAARLNEGIPEERRRLLALLHRAFPRAAAR